MKCYTQVFNVKWLTDTQLKDWIQQDRDNKDYSYSNVVRLPLKMQTNPCDLDIKNQNDTKGAIKLQNLVALLTFFLRKTVQKMNR